MSRKGIYFNSKIISEIQPTDIPILYKMYATLARTKFNKII